jgi:hypothetical protein
MTRLAIGSLLTLPLLACGGVAPTPGISVDNAPAELAKAICPKAYDCCMASQLVGNGQAGTDETTCETKTQEAFKQQLSGIKASQSKDRVLYDGTKLEACVTFLRSAACTELNVTNHFTGLPACSSFIEPQVALGGACGADYECIDGSCDKTGVTAGDGVCRALGKLGDPCGTAICEKNLTCDATAKTCAAPAPAGPPAANVCFYSSACSYTGGDRGAGSALAIGLLLAAVASRRRARS